MAPVTFLLPIRLTQPDTVFWRGGSGKALNAGKHGVVVEHNGSKVKLFWDEIESVGKPGNHGETTGKLELVKTPSKGEKPNLGPGPVDPAARRERVGASPDPSSVAGRRPSSASLADFADAFRRYVPPDPTPRPVVPPPRR